MQGIRLFIGPKILEPGQTIGFQPSSTMGIFYCLLAEGREGGLWESLQRIGWYPMPEYSNISVVATHKGKKREIRMKVLQYDQGIAGKNFTSKLKVCRHFSNRFLLPSSFLAISKLCLRFGLVIVKLKQYADLKRT